MMTVLHISLAACSLYGIGYLLQNFFIKGALPGLLALSLWWGLGCVGLSLQLLLYSWLSIPWSLFSILFPWIILVGVLLLQNTQFHLVRFSKSELLALGIILLITFILGSYSVRNPVGDLDGRLIWNFKAQAFFYQRHISLVLLQSKDLLLSHPEYPLLFPLIQSWVYMNLGIVHTGLVKVVVLGFYAHIGFLMFGLLLRQGRNIILAFLGTLLILLQPLVVIATQIDYADMPLSFFILFAGAGTWVWLTSKEKKWLIMGQIFLGAAAWTKQEGIVVWLVIVLVTVLALFISRQWQSLILFLKTLWVSVVIWFPWFLYASYKGLFWEKWGHNLNQDFIVSSVSRVEIVSSYFLHLLQSPQVGWVGYVALVVLSLFSLVVYKHRLLQFVYLYWLYVVISLLIVGYGIIYFFTPHDIIWHLATSADRLLLQLLPLFIFTIVLTCASLINCKSI